MRAGWGLDIPHHYSKTVLNKQHVSHPTDESLEEQFPGAAKAINV